MSSGNYIICDICKDSVAKIKCNICGNDICLRDTYRNKLVLKPRLKKFDVEIEKLGCKIPEVKYDIYMCEKCVIKYETIFGLLSENLGKDGYPPNNGGNLSEYPKIRVDIIRKIINIIDEEAKIMAL